MERPIYFCKSWFRAMKRPTAVWTTAQAKKAHAKQQGYAVLVDSLDHPYCFIEFANKMACVGFLDERLRESLTYVFDEIEPGKLFLQMATYREFDGETDQVLSGISYMFSQDGALHIRRESFKPHQLETASSSVDVSGNYSPAPAFGEYDELIRMERG